jgi:RNA polymerase sigma-70 factor (ECF subfamily)
MDPNDARLRRMVACCDPALDADEQVALALHGGCGLTFAEVARAFLVPTTTMARRLLEAKARLDGESVDARAGEPPWQGRLPAVMTALYLLFNEGYAAAAASGPARRDRSAEAIALTRRLRARVGDSLPELDALLALMLLHDARRATRVDERGELVRLAEQDRSRWDPQRIAEGRALVEAALRRGAPGPYALQAAIAAVHSQTAHAADTDWHQITSLYERLLRHQPSPVAALNHAVALSMCQGPEAALPLVDALAPELAHYHLWHATRAELLCRLQRFAEAIASYRRARALAHQEAERRFIRRRLAELEKIVPPPAGDTS